MHYREFPDIKVPAFLRENGWEDHSWHNDACAKSQRFFGADADGEPTRVITVWVNFENPEEREIGGRFIVEAARSYLEELSGPILYEGEDEKAAEQAARAEVEKHLTETRQ
jgi:hypothetical protein